MNNQEVVISDIKIPFVSIVFFMLKFAVAAIPAMVILHIASKFIALIR